MPHVELKYSTDLPIDVDDLFDALVDVILAHAPDAGAIKCRAYPAAHSREDHMLVDVSMLAKPNRNSQFSTAILADLEKAIKAKIPVPCYLTVGLNYSPATYLTNDHKP